MQCDPAASQLGGHPYPGGVVEDSPTASQAMTGSTLDTKQLGRFRCMPPPTGRRKQRLVIDGRGPGLVAACEDRAPMRPRAGQSRCRPTCEPGHEDANVFTGGRKMLLQFWWFWL